MKKVQELPVNMGAFVGEFAKQMFDHLPGTSNSTSHQVICSAFPKQCHDITVD